MNIGEAAKLSGLPAKTIRYYEEVGLVRPERRDNGYRNYAENDVHRLRFLRRSRSLGFSMQDARTLLALYDAKDRPREDVKRLAQRRMAEIDRKISELNALKQALAELSGPAGQDLPGPAAREESPDASAPPRVLAR